MNSFFISLYLYKFNYYPKNLKKISIIEKTIETAITLPIKLSLIDFGFVIF